MVCGRQTIDVEMLRRHTEYSGVTGTEKHIEYFWTVLGEFGQVGAPGRENLHSYSIASFWGSPFSAGCADCCTELRLVVPS